MYRDEMPELGVRNVSVERALRWLQQFSAREWPLILPVALAFFGLPRLVATVLLTRRMTTVPQTMAQLQAMSAALPGWWLALLGGVLLIALYGAMVLIAMALRPRISVGEALVEAAKRMPVALAAGAVFAVILFVALIVMLTVADLVGGGQLTIVTLVSLGMILTGLMVLLLLPIVLARHVGPIAAIRDAWRIYTGSLLRIAGGLILFGLGAWVVLLAVQVSVGTMLLLLGQTLGQRELGEVLSATLASAIAAIGWAGFYLLIAAFYRQRVGEL